jgi:hypothetical protein
MAQAQARVQGLARVREQVPVRELARERELAPVVAVLEPALGLVQVLGQVRAQAPALGQILPETPMALALERVLTPERVLAPEQVRVPARVPEPGQEAPGADRNLYFRTDTPDIRAKILYEGTITCRACFRISAFTSSCFPNNSPSI